MKTEYMLLAQYDGRAVIPIDIVCRDFFTHLTVAKLLRKVSEGAIDLPIMRLERSLKTAKCVHVSDLAAYLDRVRAEAAREATQLRRAG